MAKSAVAWAVVFLCVLRCVSQTVVWSYQSGSTAEDFCNAVAVDPNNKDVVIGGATEGTFHGNNPLGFRDWTAVKLDQDGTLQWTYHTGELFSTSEIYGVAIDASSNVVLVGKHQGSLLGAAIGGVDIAVAMLNSAGLLQWSTQQGTLSTDVATCVAVDSSGNIVVGGYIDPFGDVNPVLLKLNNAGVLQWLMTTELETTGDDHIFGLTTDDSDHIFVIGDVGASFDSNTYYGGHDAFILKTDSAGTFQWSYQIGTALDDTGMGIGISNADIYGAGHTYGSLPGYTNVGSNSDGFIVKLNAAGVQQWLVQISTASDSEELVMGLSMHPFFRRVVVFGSSRGDFNGDTNAGGKDFWAAEFDTDGSLQWSYLYGTAGEEVLSAGFYDVDGDLMLAGRTDFQVYDKTQIGGKDFVAVKLSPPSSTTTSKSVTSTITSSSTTSVTSTTTWTSSTTVSSSSTSATITSTSTLTSSTTVSSSSTSATITSTSTLTSSTTVSSSSTSATITSTSTLSSFTTVSSSSTSWTITSTSTLTSSTTVSSSSTSATITSTSTLASFTTVSSGSPSATIASTSTLSSFTTVSSSSTSWTITSTSTLTSFTTESLTSFTTVSSSSTSSTTTLSSVSSISITSTVSTSATSTATSPASRLPGTTPGAAGPTPAATVSSNSTAPDADPTVLRLTRRQIAALEADRQQSAAATIATLNAVLRAAMTTELALETELGPLNATRLVVDDLEAAGGVRILSAQGGLAFVVVSVQTLEEILLANDLAREEPLLFSVLAMNETNSLQTDAILGEASVLSTTALSVNVWRSDGTRIEVKDLVQPFRFTLQVAEPGLRCAFWDEDTAKWSTDGLTTIASTSSSLACSTSHLTIFAGIKEVFLTNVVLALTCSTLSSLLSGPAFARLQQTAWLSSVPSILNLLFHGLGAVCLLLACLYDRKEERAIPWEKRELFLMQVKDEEVEEEEDDADAPPPSRWTRCMGCCEHSMEYVSHATGGDATVDALKELVGNADTAAVNRAISTLQSHKARVARAQIAIFNKLQKEVEEGPSNQRTSRRSSISTASDGAVAETLEKTVDYGHSAAQTFLQRGWLCRVATLWPASHPCLKAMQFSMLAPMRASIALLVLKITSAGALGAVFFSSSSPGPDSDPECSPPKGGVAQVVQSLTVGLITALLSDVIVSILFAMQVKKVVFSRSEWTEKKKRRQRFRWSMWTLAFWLILLLYGGFCELYICLFLANVTDADRTEWLHSMGVALLNDLLLKSFLTAFILATIATLVLCCRPQVTEKIYAKWIKDGKELNEVAEHHSQEFELSNTDMGYFANVDIESPGFGKSQAQSDVHTSDALHEASL